MKEHLPNRFYTVDGLSVMILEMESGNYRIMEKGIMGNGTSRWFVRTVALDLDEAIRYCSAHYPPPNA